MLEADSEFGFPIASSIASINYDPELLVELMGIAPMSRSRFFKTVYKRRPLSVSGEKQESGRKPFLRPCFRAGPQGGNQERSVRSARLYDTGDPVPGIRVPMARA